MTLSTRIRFQAAFPDATNLRYQVAGGEAHTSNIDGKSFGVDCRLKGPEYYVYLSGSANSVSDVSGIVSVRDAQDKDLTGPVRFFCNNPNIGRPWFEVEDDDKSFSVNTTYTWNRNGISLTVTRLDDSADFKEWLVVLR